MAALHRGICAATLNMSDVGNHQSRDTYCERHPSALGAGRVRPTRAPLGPSAPPYRQDRRSSASAQIIAVHSEHQANRHELNAEYVYAEGACDTLTHCDSRG